MAALDNLTTEIKEAMKAKNALASRSFTCN